MSASAVAISVSASAIVDKSRRLGQGSSQLAFGEDTKLVGNGTESSQRDPEARIPGISCILDLGERK
jgi:hypothetical protein